MEEKNKGKMDEIEIDLGRVFRAVVNKAWLVAVVAALCAVLTFAGTFFFVTPEYQSSAMFYVNNSNLSLGDASLSITSGDLTTSRNLVDSYIVILNTRETLVDVLDYSGAPYTYKQLREMITAGARSCPLKVLGSDRIRWACYGAGKLYLLNTDYDLAAPVRVRAGDRELRLTLEPLELKTLEVSQWITGSI